jgi:hypothetical protein
MQYGRWQQKNENAGHHHVAIARHVPVIWQNLKKIAKYVRNNIRLFFINCNAFKTSLYF